MLNFFSFGPFCTSLTHLYNGEDFGFTLYIQPSDITNRTITRTINIELNIETNPAIIL